MEWISTSVLPSVVASAIVGMWGLLQAQRYSSRVRSAQDEYTRSLAFTPPASLESDQRERVQKAAESLISLCRPGARERWQGRQITNAALSVTIAAVLLAVVLVTGAPQDASHWQIAGRITIGAFVGIVLAATISAVLVKRMSRLINAESGRQDAEVLAQAYRDSNGEV